MFIELHSDGYPYSINTDKITRFFPRDNKTQVYFDSSVNYSAFVFDEDYKTVKQLIGNARKQGNL